MREMAINSSSGAQFVGFVQVDSIECGTRLTMLKTTQQEQLIVERNRHILQTLRASPHLGE